MVYIVYGEDDFSRAQFLAQLKEGIGDGASGLLPANLTVLAGGQLSLQELTLVCDAYPFLAEKRLVVVEGLLSRFERRAREGEAERARRLQAEARPWVQALTDYLPRMPPTTVLAFVDGSLRRGNPLLQALSPLARVEEFAPLRPLALKEWLAARVAQAGGSISPPAVNLLAEMVGPNLWALTNEVDKLVTYCQGDTIGLEEVRLLVAQSREVTVFAFVDALLEGPRSRAQLLLHRLFLDGATSPYLVVMVARQLRHLIQAQEMIAGGLSQQQAVERLGLTGFPLRKAWEQAHRLAQARLVDIYDRLLGVDVAVKTGRCPEQVAWELLVAEAAPAG